MTDREAIGILSEYYSYCDLTHKVELAQLIALKALQEREAQNKACSFCLDATVDPELDGCDLSYNPVGYACDGHRILIGAGANESPRIITEVWNGDHWSETGFYYPKFCPECGRKLKGERTWID